MAIVNDDAARLIELIESGHDLNEDFEIETWPMCDADQAVITRPIMWAMALDRQECIEILLSSDPWLWRPTGSRIHHYHLLHTMWDWKPSARVVDMLLADFPPVFQERMHTTLERDGYFWLKMAVAANHQYGTAALLAVGTRGDEARRLILDNPLGCEVLEVAVWENKGVDAELLQLLSRNGVNLNGCTPRESSIYVPLLRAAWIGQVAAVQALLECGVDPNVTDGRGRTANELVSGKSMRETVLIRQLLDRYQDLQND